MHKPRHKILNNPFKSSPWHPLVRIKCAIENMSHGRRSEGRYTDGGRGKRERERERGSGDGRETARRDSYRPHYLGFWGTILPCHKKAEANQYCHSQLQIKLPSLLLPPCSFVGHSMCRNSDKRIPIDCWWDQRINKWKFLLFFFPPSLCLSFFPFSSLLQNGQGVKQWSKTHKKTAVINKHNKTLI